MKKTRMQKGITLIALIITIVLLMILAAVAISSIQNDSIIGYADNSIKEYEEAEKEEQTILDKYEGYLNIPEQTTLQKAQEDTMLSKTANSIAYDEYGNKIVVPAGFKIRVDDSTNNASNVTQGIVIEDKDGNQFVWVPVGKIYTSTDKSTYKTITLGRYSDFTANDAGEYTPAQPTADNPYTSEVNINIYSDVNARECQPTSSVR